MEPIFDLIDQDNNEMPEGFAYAYGFDYPKFNSYYGIVEVDKNGVIGDPVIFEVSNCPLGADTEVVEAIKSSFRLRMSNQEKEVA